MKLKLTDIFALKAAFERLTSYWREDNSGNLVLVPFNFSGKMRWDIGRNIGICEKAHKHWQKNIVEPLQKELGITSETKEKDPLMLELNKRAFKQAEEIEEEYEIKQLSYDELTNDKNPVSGDVLNVIQKYGLATEPNS